MPEYHRFLKHYGLMLKFLWAVPRTFKFFTFRSAKTEVDLISVSLPSPWTDILSLWSLDLEHTEQRTSRCCLHLFFLSNRLQGFGDPAYGQSSPVTCLFQGHHWRLPVLGENATCARALQKHSREPWAGAERAYLKTAVKWPTAFAGPFGHVLNKGIFSCKWFLTISLLGNQPISSNS